MKLVIVSSKINEITDLIELQNSIQKIIFSEENKFIFKIIFPKDKKYKVEEIKEILKPFYIKKNLSNSNEVLVIMHAENLSDIVQNLLLKTLEETIHPIIFVTNNLNSLLPTLLSRCQIIYDNKEKIIKDKNFHAINVDIISQLNKLERDEVVNFLENLLDENRKFQENIFIEESIRKINSNCKIESVLYELVWRVSRMVEYTNGSKNKINNSI